MTDIAAVPGGLTDCHSHVYPRGWRESGNADSYLDLCRRLDIRRSVLVQPVAIPDPLATIGMAHALGSPRCILFFDEPALGDTDPLDWHEKGVRGFRFLARPGQELDMAALRRGAEIACAQGWHVNVQAEGETLVRHLDALAGLPCPVVLDHLGRVPRQSAACASIVVPILDFLRDGGWMKLSAPYNVTPDGSSDFGKVEQFVRACVDSARERLVWAVNFPHPNLPVDGKPDEAETLRSLMRIVPEPELRELIFRDNPQRLFGFD